MSDYFGNLAARALGLTVTARPRPSLFEPRRGAVESGPVALDEPSVAAERRAPERALDAPEHQLEPEERHPVREERAREPERTASHPRLRPQGQHLDRAVRKEPTKQSPVARPPTTKQPRAPKALPPEAAEVPAEGQADALPTRPVRAKRAPPLLAARPPGATVRTKQASPPTVRVTIGRVDVRAVAAEKPLEPRPKPRRAPRMSLDEYLSRERGRAR